VHRSRCGGRAASPGGTVQLAPDDLAARARSGGLRGARTPTQPQGQVTPEQRHIAALEAKNARLARELEQARAIIDVQKKLYTLLGLPTSEPIEDSGSES
jgi:hypothetical protein